MGGATVMPTRAAIGFVVFSLASVVEAEVNVELVPSRPGPCWGGESLTVDVCLHSEVPTDEALVGVQFDFQVGSWLGAEC